MAVHVLGPVLLTERLQPLLAARRARVVTSSSTDRPGTTHSKVAYW